MMVPVIEPRYCNLSHRVVEWFGKSQAAEPTDANYLGSFTAQNGAGTEGEMAEGS
jgi:hypothetical protein